ncbi:MAG: hypothetical protein ACE5I1_30280 [bacterium]
MKKHILQNIALLTLSSCLALLLLEALSRVFLKVTSTHLINAKGEIASMQLEPGNPAKGLKPFFDGRLVSNEFDVAVCLDSNGFRPRIMNGDQSNEDSICVTLLGDSFMFGWGVEYQKSFATFIAEDLYTLLRHNIIITSRTVPGTGQFSQLSLLESFPPSKSDLFLIGMYITDHAASGNDLIENLSTLYQQQGVTSDTENELRVSVLRRARRWLKQNSNLFRFVETRVGAVLLSKFSHAIQIESDPQVFDRAWSVTDSALVAIQGFAEKYGALCLVIYIPNMLDMAQKNDATYKKLQAICGRNSLSLAPNPIALFHSGTKDFNVADFYYSGDGHWTARAHEIVAESTAQFLIDEFYAKKNKKTPPTISTGNGLRAQPHDQ